MRSSEIRRLSQLLNALMEDSELMAQLSVLQSDQIAGAAEVLRSLYSFVDSRDLDESLTEG
jgi:hypothetical protein